MSYRIKQDTVFVENEPTYVIESTNSNELVLVDYSEDKSCLCRRHFFNRTESLKEVYCCDEALKPDEPVIGTWKEFKIEWKDSTKGKCNHEPLLILSFKINHKMIDDFNGTQTPMSYRIDKDSVIIESKTRWIIEKVSADELILSDYILDSFGNLMSTSQLHY